MRPTVHTDPARPQAASSVSIQWRAARAEMMPSLGHDGWGRDARRRHLGLVVRPAGGTALAPRQFPSPPRASPGASVQRPHSPQKTQWGKAGRTRASAGRVKGITTLGIVQAFVILPYVELLLSI